MAAWDAGPFYVAVAMALVIAAVASARIAYVDRRYKAMIRDGMVRLEAYEGCLSGTEPGAGAPPDELADAALATSESAGYVRAARSDNMKEGFAIDAAAAAAILALGYAASLGVLGEPAPFLMLGALLAVLLAMPVIHCAKHAALARRQYRAVP